MNNDAADIESSASGGYISFVAHLWVAENGKLIRGTIEDVHTGTKLALDLSEVVAFLQTSLAHSPGQAWNLQNEESEEMSQERPREGSGEGPSVADIQDESARSPQKEEEG